MFQVTPRLGGVAAIAVLNKVFGLDCSESPNVHEGLDFGIPKIVSACPRGSGFLPLWVSSRRSALIVANLARIRLITNCTAASALASRVRSFPPSGRFRGTTHT